MGMSAPLTPKSARVMAAVKLQHHTGRVRSGLFLAEGPNLVEAAAAQLQDRPLQFLSACEGFEFFHEPGEMIFCKIRYMR